VLFPLVIRVAVVPKQKQAVPNVSVATRVKRVLATVAHVNNAPLVNRVSPMMQRPILVRLVTRGTIKKIWARRRVCRAYREHMKMTLVRPNVKIAAKDNIKMHRVTKRVWLAKWVNS